MKKLILALFIFAVLFSACNKEKQQIRLIKGGYKLEYASIDGEDVTALLLNDTVNLTQLIVGEEEGVLLFFIYFYPEADRNSYYTSTCSFVDETSLSIYNKTIGEDMTKALHNNLAFFPFSKQISFVLNIEELTEIQLTFNTIYSGKKYRYVFKD
jgi:hypothetical protein